MFTLNVRDTIFCAILLSRTPYQCMAHVFLETVACCQSEIYCCLPVNILRSAPRESFLYGEFYGQLEPLMGSIPLEKIHASMGKIRGIYVTYQFITNLTVVYSQIHFRLCQRLSLASLYSFPWLWYCYYTPSSRSEQITIVKVQKKYLSLFVLNFLGSVACDNVDSCTCFWDG